MKKQKRAYRKPKLTPVRIRTRPDVLSTVYGGGTATRCSWHFHDDSGTCPDWA